MKRKVLVVDIGGTHVKLLMSVRDQRDFASGPQMRPKYMCKLIQTFFVVMAACGGLSAQTPAWQPSPGHTQVPIWHSAAYEQERC